MNSSHGTWELEQMMDACKTNLVFRAYSIWNNVVLHAWVDGKHTNVVGDYLTRVMLYYYPDTAAMAADPIGEYP